MRVGEGRTYSRGRERDIKDATRGQLAGWWGEDQCAQKGRGVRANVWAATMDGMHAPLFVNIDSISRGATAWTYVQVQTSKNMTRGWKLNSADCGPRF